MGASEPGTRPAPQSDAMPWTAPFIAVLARKRDDLSVVGPLIERSAPGPVLDLAGGFGRLAVVAARAGSRVLVVDSSGPLLCHGERTVLASEAPAVAGRIEWRRGDIQVPMDLRGDRALALLAYFAVNELLYEDGLATVLANARRGLAPGGLLYIEALPEPPYPRPGVFEELESVEAAGETWRVWTRVEHVAPNLHELQLRYVGGRTGELALQRILRRVWTRRELDALAGQAGLRRTRAAGDGRFHIYGR